MIGVMMKNIRYWILYPVVFFVGINAYYVAEATRISMEMAVLNSLFLYFLTMSSLLSVEAIEERYRGYEFLRTLPVRMRDIVLAKFMMPLIVIAVITAANVAMMGSLLGPPEVLARCRGTVIANAGITLVIAGLVYILVYRYGVKFIMLALGGFLLVLNVAGMLAAKGLIPGIARVFRGYGALTPGWGLAAGCAVAVAAYFGLLPLAIRLRSAMKG